MKTEHESTIQKHMKNVPYTVLKTNLQWAKKKNIGEKWRSNWWISQITIKILIWDLFIKLGLHNIKKPFKNLNWAFEVLGFLKN